MIKPTETFRAVVPGSAYPQTFKKGEEIAPDTVAARAALDLDILTKADATAVRKAQASEEEQLGDTKAQGSAPENKSV